MEALSRDQIREIDRRAIEEYGISSLVLMENAARGATDLLCQLGIDGPVVICCGRGNNGGDGLAMARHLDLRGFEVRVWHTAAEGKWSGDAAIQAAITEKCGIPCESILAKPANAFEDAAWLVDALLGTGTQGPPRPPYDQILRELNQAGGRRFAIDIPSGLDCDSGEVHEPTFQADHTCTFVAAKHGLLHPGARAVVGRLHVADIGAPRKLIASYLSPEV